MARITSVTQRQFTVTAPDQSLDRVLNQLTFNIGTGFNSEVWTILQQTDGKILVGGSFTSYNGVTQNRITRLNADGTRDTSFVIGTGFNGRVNTIALQPDGKILVGADFFTSYNGVSQNYAARLNADGSLDADFFGTGFNNRVNAIVIQPDGKILVGGGFSTYKGETQNRITRLNADGTRDTGFATTGTGFGNTIQAILLQPDGKILVGGSFSTYDIVTQQRITRLNADGSRDTGFNSGTGFNEQINAMALQSDGKIIVGGVFTSYNGTTQNRITRLNADGTRDTGFSIGTGFGNNVWAIALRPDGKILAGGQFTSYNGTSQTRITRLNADGTRDTEFSIGFGFNGNVYAIALQLDGKTIVGGNFTGYHTSTRNRITKLTSSGLIQPTTLTVATYDVASGGGFDGTVSATAVQADGKILVGGSFTSYKGVTQNRITRLNADGTRDTGFSIGTGFSNSVTIIALQPDGKILVGGSFGTYNGTSQNNITRLNADGTRDTGFNSGTGFNASPIDAIALQSDGKILVGGSFTSYNGVTQNRITRLNADGTRDTGFSIGTGFTGGLQIVYAIAIQSNGKILVGGNFTTYNEEPQQNRISRLNADGSRDTGFVIGTGFNSVVLAIAIQADGKILVGGAFTEYNVTTQNRITRLLADGSTDPGWYSLGSGFNGDPQTIALQSDGKILVGGLFSAYNGTTQNSITRLNTDGTRDTGFSIGTGFNSSVYANITIQSDGKILAGGQFTLYNGVTQNRFTRLNTDGSLAIVDNVDEGVQLNFVIPTANVRDGTVLRWRILDRPNDFAVNTDTVTVTSNTASFTVTPTADLQTEGAETFRVQLEKTTGTIVGVTSAVTINDTSLSP